MAIMLGNVFRAFREAGVGDELAQKAAEGLASDVGELKRDVHLLEWMVGANLALTLSLVVRAFY